MGIRDEDDARVNFTAADPDTGLDLFAWGSLQAFYDVADVEGLDEAPNKPRQQATDRITND